MGTVINQEPPITMASLFGKELSGSLCIYITELFGPAISRVAEQSVLAGKNKEQVIDAVTTTAEAMVVGLRAVVSSASSSSEDQQLPGVTLTVKVPEGQQT